ncbi:MAG: hypothetical protein PHI98_17005 [Eubacteriales bacterium]|nr:hypothetical protein [Eubacteriales bacterium]
MGALEGAQRECYRAHFAVKPNLRTAFACGEQPTGLPRFECLIDK